jgi:hypothetical protein
MSLEMNSKLYATKSEKYTRFNNEKRVKRTPGEKRTQTEKITTTKWKPEIAKNKANKIGRKRDRDYKYGKWDYGRTDSCSEDKSNDKANKAMRERLRVAALERRGVYQRSAFADISDLLFPVLDLKNKDSWAPWAWESYYEMKDLKQGFKWEPEMSAAEWTKEMWRRADANEYL